MTAIHFHFLDPRGRRWQPPENLLPPISKRIASVDLFELLCQRIVRLDDLPGGRVEAEAYLSAMLVGLRAGRTDPPATNAPLAVAEQMIREQPGDIESIGALAARAGMSAEHFSRSFRKTFGKSPQDTLIDARVGRACQMLEHNQLPINRIAELLGYRDVFFFSRQFKQRVGQSPSRWRASVRKI